MTKVPWRGRMIIAVGLLPALVLAGCGSGSKSNSASAGTSTLTVGELLPFTGKIANIIKGAVTGVDTAIKTINANGGVMGHPLTAVPQDTAGDVADAVTGWRALQLHKPSFEVGPTTLEGSAVVNLYDAARIPDFLFDGSPGLDNATFKYVFRGQPSDSEQGTTMAFYANHIGVKHAAFMITSDAAGETLVPSLTKSYEAHGGTIVYKNLLTPGQTSYRTEIEAAFAQHPDGIFLHTDEATGGTILHDMESLGDLNLPLIDDTLGNSPTIAKSMGLDLASRYLIGTDSSSSAGPASRTYTSLYAQYQGGAQPAPSSSIFYDGVNVFALAMVAAKSTDPKVWVNFVTTVSNPPGTACYDYVGCANLLKSGQKINYEGVSGSYDYNSHHNIFSDFAASGWNPDGTQKVVLPMSQSDLAAFAGT